jgi:hypothetical protein
LTLEDDLAFQLDACGIKYERQYKAIPDRRFRYDFAIFWGWGGRLLVEVQGGVYQYKPSHTSASGIRRDCEKNNLAILHGYLVLHFTSDMVQSGEALKIIEQIIRRTK